MFDLIGDVRKEIAEVNCGWVEPRLEDGSGQGRRRIVTRRSSVLGAHRSSQFRRGIQTL